jgi:DHA1 family bicyclomycin/chloramphenicol resistance-like MFS transporter
MDNARQIRFLDRTTPPHITTLILLAGMSAIVMNIFLPSLPQMAEYFDTEYAVMQLSVPLYLLCSAVMQLFIGPISDNLGRRRVMLWGCLANAFGAAASLLIFLAGYGTAITFFGMMTLVGLAVVLVQFEKGACQSRCV